MNKRQQLITRNKQLEPDKSRSVPTSHCIECFKPVIGVPYSFAGGLAFAALAGFDLGISFGVFRLILDLLFGHHEIPIRAPDLIAIISRSQHHQGDRHP